MRTPEKPDLVDDPDAPASEEEIAASARLRDALEGAAAAAGAAGAADGAAELLRAVSLAHGPRELPDPEHRALVARVLAEAEAGRAGGAPERGGRVIRGRFGVALGVAGALALAAGVMLLVRPQAMSAAPLATSAPAAAPASGATPLAARLARPRSTQPLFDEPFAREARASTRIDRIASARSSDLRENRFARWGVR